MSNVGLKCARLNVKRNYYYNQVHVQRIEHIDPHIVGVTDSWANSDIAHVYIIGIGHRICNVFESQKREPREECHNTSNILRLRTEYNFERKQIGE